MNKTMKQKKLVIFGAGEIACLAKFYFSCDSEYEVVAFTADDEFVVSKTFEGLPLVPFSQVTKLYPPGDYEMHVGLSYSKLNQTREEKYHLAKRSGYTLASYVSSRAITWDDLSIGDNCFILEGQNIQPTVKICSNVMLWSGNHIGHRTVICDHVYFASHICVSGYCNIGERTFVGVNSSFRDFCQVGSDCFITMGACVTQASIKPGSVVLGQPADILSAEDPRAIRIKKRYFKL